MVVRTAAILQRLRSSLFFVPLFFVLVSIGLAIGGIILDTRIVDANAQLPFGLTSTVDSARAVLSTVAGATITFAGIAFSVSLLLIQQASSQYSPRVIQGLFRDPFNKRIMGVVVGTFSYCLIVLRSVRGPLEQTGSPVIPNLSVAVAVVLGVVSILAIVAFISHSAHSMDVSEILHRATEDASDAISARWHRPDEDDDHDDVSDRPESDHALRVVLDRSGWIQAIDFDGLAKAADEGGTVRVDVSVGRYSVPGTTLCLVDPRPEDEDAAIDRARSSLIIGQARATDQDVTYGVRQLADVALKALSPGINDPTTAQDALFHLGRVVRELLVRRPPPHRRAMDGDRVLELRQEPSHEDIVAMAFDEVRLAARGMPTVCIYLLELLQLLDRSLRHDECPAAIDALRQQARLVREGASDADLLPHDRRRVEEAYDRRFG